MSWSSRKKKESSFCTVYFIRRKFFLTFVFYLSIWCIEYTFRIYILLHTKKHYFIHFCCLFLKSSKAFYVSVSCSPKKLSIASFVERPVQFNIGKRQKESPLDLIQDQKTKNSCILHFHDVSQNALLKEATTNCLFHRASWT